jgi:hypothetical protein
MRAATSRVCRVLAGCLIVSGCVREEAPLGRHPEHSEPAASQAAEATQCTEVSVHCGSTPSVVFDARRRLWAVFAQAEHVYVTVSDDLGERYAPAVQVNPEPETIETNGENRPKIAVDGGGAIYVSWTRKVEGRFNADVRFSRSLDGGRSFEPPRTVNDDGLVLGHRFDSLRVDAAGDVYLAWIDKRDLEAAKARGRAYRGAAVYYTVSTDRGASFAPNRRVADHACECCRIAMTARPEGGVAVLWRHVFDADTRDHAFATLGAEAASSPPQRATHDGWRIDACPHHGPAITAADEASYHLAWFTAVASRPVVYYGRFHPTTGAIHRQAAMTTTAGGAHPDVVESSGRLLVVWKELDGERTSIVLRTSADGGETWGEPEPIASTAGRSDHPFLVQRGAETFVSWHTGAEGLRILPVHGVASGREHLLHRFSRLSVTAPASG